MYGQEETREENTKETEEGWGGGRRGRLSSSEFGRRGRRGCAGRGVCCYGRVERNVGVHVKVNARRVVDQRFARGVPVKQNLVLLFFSHAYSHLFYLALLKICLTVAGIFFPLPMSAGHVATIPLLASHEVSSTYFLVASCV